MQEFSSPEVKPVSDGRGRLSIPSPVPPPSAAPQPEFKQSWQPVNVVVPDETAKPRSTPWGIAVVAIAVVVAAGLVFTHLGSADKLPAGTDAFVAGGGVTYTSPDGSFQAQLPSAPTTGQQSMAVAGSTVTVYAASVATPSYQVVAASLVFPTPQSADRMAAVIDQVMTEGIAGLKGTVEHKNLATRDSNPAVEGTFKLADGTEARLLAVSSSSTLIVALVHATSGTGRLFKALEDSLIVS